MIRVTVELVSAISPSRSRVLGVAEISNDATGTPEIGNYNVRLSKWAPKTAETWKRGRVIGFRRRVRGPWDLLFLALRNTVGGRNPTVTGSEVIGQRFGRWTVLGVAPDSTPAKQLLHVRCDCGAEKTTVLLANLLRGLSRSCGCYQRDRAGESTRTHGKSRTREHRIWCGMISRCTLVTNVKYPRYGGRGIKVCERWRRSFADFLADVGPAPSPRHSLDRIDNDGNYEPGNCRWATAVEQGMNTGKNVVLEIRGEKLCVTEWARRYGIAMTTVWNRLRRGWPPEVAVTTPPLTNGQWQRRQRSRRAP